MRQKSSHTLTKALKATAQTKFETMYPDIIKALETLFLSDASSSHRLNLLACEVLRYQSLVFQLKDDSVSDFRRIFPQFFFKKLACILSDDPHFSFTESQLEKLQVLIKKIMDVKILECSSEMNDFLQRMIAELTYITHADERFNLFLMERMRFGVDLLSESNLSRERKITAQFEIFDNSHVLASEFGDSMSKGKETVIKKADIYVVINVIVGVLLNAVMYFLDYVDLIPYLLLLFLMGVLIIYFYFYKIDVRRQEKFFPALRSSLDPACTPMIYIQPVVDQLKRMIADIQVPERRSTVLKHSPTGSQGYVGEPSPFTVATRNPLRQSVLATAVDEESPRGSPAVSAVDVRWNVKGLLEGQDVTVISYKDDAYNKTVMRLNSATPNQFIYWDKNSVSTLCGHEISEGLLNLFHYIANNHKDVPSQGCQGFVFEDKHYVLKHLSDRFGHERIHFRSVQSTTGRERLWIPHYFTNVSTEK